LKSRTGFRYLSKRYPRTWLRRFSVEKRTTYCGPGKMQVYELLRKGMRDFLVERAARDIIELHEKLDLDIVRPPLIPSAESKGPTKMIGRYTYYFEDSSAGLWWIYRYNPVSMEFMLVDSSIKREGVTAIERLIEANEKSATDIDDSIFDVYDIVVDELGDERVIAGYGGIGIPIEESWLSAVIMRPQLIERYLDQQVKRTLKLITASKDHGADFILGGGDLAGTKGPVYSPKIFKRCILPRLRRITCHCHELGLPYIFRTDGNVWPIAKELFGSSGVDGYGEIDAQAGMKLGDLKRAFPNLILWGNVDRAKTLVFGPTQKVVAETKLNIDEAAPGRRLYSRVIKHDPPKCKDGILLGHAQNS